MLLAVLCWINAAQAQRQTHTTESALRQLGEIEDLPRFETAGPVMQFSSYDTTGGNNDGFGGQYSFIRRNEDSTLVIFEDTGKGMINRIWTPTPTSDTLDFYFDGEKNPSYSIRFLDLFTGKVFPFTGPLCGNEVGGYYCYFPILYNKGCKIVFRGKHLQFYQIQYRHLPPRDHVKSFSAQEESTVHEAFDQLAQHWKAIPDMAPYQTFHKDTQLHPGDTLTLAKINTGGRLTGLRFYDTDIWQGVERQLDLRITWDGEERAAINVPYADFFGYAFGNVSMQSLLIGSRDHGQYCYFPMPFDRSAQVQLIYRKSESTRPIQVQSDVFYSDTKRRTTQEGKFYAFWNSDKTQDGKPHVFLEGEGHGHYVGTILQAQGLNPGMTIFFEGDDITRIDGRMTAHGTGSEDYFNGGWYALMDRWDRKLSLPLHGSLEYNLPFARTGGYRLFLLDKLSFSKEIRHTIEHGPEQNNVPGIYTSVAFYYADRSLNEDQRLPGPENTTTYIPKVFTYYPQLCRYTIGGDVHIANSLIESAAGGQVRLDLSDLPKGKYKVYADIEKYPQGANVEFWQRQKPLSDPFSFKEEKRTAIDHQYLCELEITDFIKTLTIRFSGKEDHSGVVIKRWILEQQAY